MWWLMAPSWTGSVPLWVSRWLQLSDQIIRIIQTQSLQVVPQEFWYLRQTLATTGIAHMHQLLNSFTWSWIESPPVPSCLFKANCTAIGLSRASCWLIWYQCDGRHSHRMTRNEFGVEWIHSLSKFVHLPDYLLRLLLFRSLQVALCPETWSQMRSCSSVGWRFQPSSLLSASTHRPGSVARTGLVYIQNLIQKHTKQSRSHSYSFLFWPTLHPQLSFHLCDPH